VLSPKLFLDLILLRERQFGCDCGLGHCRWLGLGVGQHCLGLYLEPFLGALFVAFFWRLN
jgi:hypothetical protein